MDTRCGTFHGDIFSNAWRYIKKPQRYELKFVFSHVRIIYSMFVLTQGTVLLVQTESRELRETNTNSNPH